MSLDVKTLDCNGFCADCYERRIRSAGRRPEPDIGAIIETIKRETNPNREENDKNRSPTPCLHGGEPLLLGKRDIERIFNLIFNRFGRTDIITNGLALDDEWISLFQRFRTSVCVSLDGDTAELNRGRWTALAEPFVHRIIQIEVDKILRSIIKLRVAGISVSVIAVMRKCNCGPDRLDQFIDFLKRLASDFGIYNLRTNPGIVFEPSRVAEWELSPAELGNAFEEIAAVGFTDNRFGWQPYRDVVDRLVGFPDATCVFCDCDPFATSAERPILEDGSIGNCLKSGTALDGIASLRTAKPSRAREEILKGIPYPTACGGCKYWPLCRGACPGEAIDNDWRNKSRFCEGYLRLYRFIERRLTGLFPNLNTSALPEGRELDFANIWRSLGPNGSTWKYNRRRPPIGKESPEKRPEKKMVNVAGHGDSNDPAWRALNPWWPEAK